MCSSPSPYTRGSPVLRSSGLSSLLAILPPSSSPGPICSGYGSGRLRVGITQAVKKVQTSFRSTLGFYRKLTCPRVLFFSSLGLSYSRIGSSRSDRLLVRGLKSSPPTTENHPTSTKATTDLKVGHKHQRCRSQAGVPRYSITGLWKIPPTSSRVRKRSGFGYRHEALRFLNKPGNVSFYFPFPSYGRERLVRRRLSRAIPLLCVFG